MKVFDKTTFFKTLHYVPHEKQQLMHDSTARFRTLVCGRRWGKSLSVAMEICAAMASKADQRGWVVAPDYELSTKIFREIYWSFHKYLPSLIKDSSMSKGSMHLELKNGSVVFGKSADNPVSLIGEGLDFLAIDEAARIKSDCWYEALRPTIADRKGWVIFISTPTHKNWFFKEYMSGVNKEPDCESWHFTSYTNPYLDRTEIDNAKLNIPSMTFRQEFLGEFVESADCYFDYDLVDSCIDNNINLTML